MKGIPLFKESDVKRKKILYQSDVICACYLYKFSLTGDLKAFKRFKYFYKLLDKVEKQKTIFYYRCLMTSAKKKIKVKC